MLNQKVMHILWFDAIVPRTNLDFFSENKYDPNKPWLKIQFDCSAC